MHAACVRVDTGSNISLILERFYKMVTDKMASWRLMLAAYNYIWWIRYNVMTYAKL